MRGKLLLLTMLTSGLKLFAYTTDNFITQMRDEGYDVQFVDQHENIVLLLLGILLIYIACKYNKTRDTIFAMFFSGILLAMYAFTNMILGVTYSEYLIYAIPMVIIICALVYSISIFTSLKSVITGKIFICIPIFYVSLLLMGLWSYFVDYNLCDKHTQWPSEYGLQWRPIYEGFTDKSYFKSIEREVDSTDSSKILENLLSNESHTFDHSFDILKAKGWTVGNTHRTQFFVNPSSEMGYVQILKGGGLEPYYTKVIRVNEIFDDLNLSQLKRIHLVGNLNDNNFVAVTEDSDSLYLYVSYDKNNSKEGDGFVCVRDSIIALPYWKEINPFENDLNGTWFHVKQDYYDAHQYLRFPVDSIHDINFEDYGFIVRYKNPDISDKFYAIDAYSLAREMGHNY